VIVHSRDPSARNPAYTVGLLRARCNRPRNLGAATGVKAMLANRLAKYAALRGIYYGWVMAALAFFYVLFSSSGLVARFIQIAG
jgi:hypothetical protein